jgi:hypothetical protein
MYGRAFAASGSVAFRDAASLEGAAEAFQAVIGQMVAYDRSQAAAAARNAYLRSLTGLPPLLYRDDGEGP